MLSKIHIGTKLRLLCQIDQKVSIFVEKLKKMQILKMIFRSKLEPLIKNYDCFKFCKISDLEITVDWWIYYQKNLRFLCEIDQKVPTFVEKLKKMQPLKMTFRSQLGSSIKSYECFMFLPNTRLEINMDWWIRERP